MENTPFRLALVNLCEDAYGYGAGAAEYLEAAVRSAPELRDRVDVRIFFLQGSTAEQAAETVLAWSPDLVGFSAYSWNLAITGETSRIMRRLAPERPIVWGGCSFLHLRQRHDWFEWWDAVDAVVVGYGELTLIELLGRLLERPGRRTASQLAPGLVTQVDGVVRSGPPGRQPMCSDQIPSPYLLGSARHVPRPYVEMARGCVFNCTFCSDAKSSRQIPFLHHPADRIAAEIAHIVAWPEAEWIDAGASTANVSDQAFLDVCEAIRRGDPNQRLQYSFQLYPSLVRPGHRDALQGIRIGKHLIGLQSLSPATFAPMRRGSRLEHLRRAVDLLAGTGPIHVSVILGLPGETLASFAQMMDLLVEIEPLRISVHRLLVLPGTQMHTQSEALGLKFDPKLFYRATQSSSMSNDDLRAAQELVMEHGRRSDRAGGDRFRIDWTNFDIQRKAFDPPIPEDANSVE
ncbi:MAG: radical SAM protein [Deltaproteobacteria bacterium]|nr:radical SAM protein [Deltaproteobacteria bacterium]